MEITEDRRKGRGVTVKRPDKGFPGVLEKTEWDRGNIYRKRAEKPLRQ